MWQFLRHNFLNSRIFETYDAIVAACCDAWNRLRAMAMNLHLAEISTQVAADGHAVVILDQAGWHGVRALRVPLPGQIRSITTRDWAKTVNN